MADTTHDQAAVHSPFEKQAGQQSVSVSFKPARSDTLNLTTVEALRQSPLSLALRDVTTFFGMLSLFPTIFLPFGTNDPTNEFYLRGSNVFGLAVLAFVSILQALLLVLAIPAFIFLPGGVIVLVLVLGTLLIRILCYPIQGPPIAESDPFTDPHLIARQESLASERWVFLNGCCVTQHALKQNVNVLAQTFGRPVIGIHNRTYGIVGDIVECIIQRAFGFYSEETQVAYGFVKKYCSDPAVTKVVLIGHSQGGIMVSQVLDELYMELPNENVGKLEVYTFASAASHCNNPLQKMAVAPQIRQQPGANISNKLPNILPNYLQGAEDGVIASPTSITFSLGAREASTQRSSPNKPNPTPPASSPQPPRHNIETKGPAPIVQPTRVPTISPFLPDRVIPHIEHYCNSKDMVTRWGALYSVKHVLDNRFCGHVFISEGGSGHMLNQHYLAKMFPRTAAAAGNEIPFLDRVVEADSATVKSPDHDAKGNYTILQQDAELNDIELGERRHITPKDLQGAEGSRITVVRVPSASSVKQAHGKTVRQVSRLWRYMGGADPDAPPELGSDSGRDSDS